MKCEYCGADKDNVYEALGTPCCEAQRVNYPEVPQKLMRVRNAVVPIAHISGNIKGALAGAIQAGYGNLPAAWAIKLYLIRN